MSERGSGQGWRGVSVANGQPGPVKQETNIESLRQAIMEEAREEARQTLDDAKAKAYCQALNTLKELLNITGELPLEWVLSKEELIKPKDRDIDIEKVWGCLRESLSEVLRDLYDMRCKEGDYIAGDFKQRLDLIAKYMDQIELESQDILGIYKKKYLTEFSRLLGLD